ACPRAVNPQTTSCFCRWQTGGHSAHVGQVVEVHYRWHALYGRRLRRQYGEHRATGDVVHVEVEPGVVLVVAAWMLDAAFCSDMELGEPRASVTALADLHHLLSTLGFRRSSCGVINTDYEEQYEPPTKIKSDAASSTPPDGAAPTEHCVRVRGTRGNESRATSQRGHSTGHLALAGSRSSDEGGEQ
ncbi:MAG TPA: hypothetical protein PK441_13335, partial [Burkholderiaceae bacterium]|nr:hypothetical protein [Burkholderiaceae bacterium]